MAYGINKKAPQRETTPPALIAWHVSERGENKFWNRIGAAWEHKDGDGLTLQLDVKALRVANAFSSIGVAFIGRQQIRRADLRRHHGNSKHRNRSTDLHCSIPSQRITRGLDIALSDATS